MKSKSRSDISKTAVSRRKFIGISGAALAGTTLPMCSRNKSVTKTSIDKDPDKIKITHALGRTGFQASDISMGCGSIKESNVVRYAYDKGINYFDTAETYGNGDSERKIGEAMEFMERKRIFITTKLAIGETDTEETIMERFGKCRERMKTDYVDALFMHSVTDVQLLKNAGFHAAVGRLKTDGRLKHAGVSSHGPGGSEGESMEKVLCAAAEDGRFDLMLLVYNFMNKEAGEKVLSACKENNVGTTAMKTSPGVLEVTPFDPENPAGEYADHIERMLKRGMTREQANERIKNWVEAQKESEEKTGPFMKKYGIKTEEQLRRSSIQWVLNNPDMQTITVSTPDYDRIDEAVSLSGTRFSDAQQSFLRDYQEAFNDRYCRHGCNACAATCSHRLPVSTIMRYAQYYRYQGREKYAMAKYAGLGERNALSCAACDAACKNACPHAIDVQANMLRAHSLLSMA